MEHLPKFSSAERQIIELLVEHEELFGLQMVELSGGRLKRGTVYVTLGRMQEKGYLESRQEPPDRPAGDLAAQMRRGHVLQVMGLVENQPAIGRQHRRFLPVVG